MSVLFADLVGFTPFSEERDAEDVRETLTRYFEAATAVVARYGGTLEKFIGDAVMAVWGSPVAREDDAERAVRAGLDLVAAVRDLGAGIEARAGVLTGEAAVTLGAENQGMVVGDLVNTASRLQGVAEPGTVLVGEATMRAASNAITFEPSDERTLKGKSSPVQAYRALRVVAELGGRGRTDVIEPPFLGRDEELRLMKQLLDSTGRDRRARLVTISGPAGIGKTRLVWELEKYVDGMVEPVYWNRGRSPSYGQGITFWALSEMVRGRAGLAEADDEATTRERVRTTVAEFVSTDEDRRWVEPALLTLLGLEPPPAGGRDVLFAAWRIFFEGIAQRGTTVLLFEDIQWADPGLLDFTDHLLEWSRGWPILVIAVTRPELFEKRPDWGTAHRNASTVTPEPLSDQVMRELLLALVPRLSARAVEQVVQRADGVPLYAVEMVRSLLSDGLIARDGNSYRVVGEVGSITVPASLHSLIGARLDSLPTADRALLQEAAVLGQSFTASALKAITTQPEADVEAQLRSLVRREMLTVQLDPRSPERGQFAFVQSLTREVAYSTLSKRERRQRHLAAARHFEAMGDSELAGALAAHYLAAYEASSEGPEADAVAVQARHSLRAAADRALAVGSHEHAVSYLQQAATLTSDASELAELHARAARSLSVIGRNEEAIGLARRAAAAAAQTADPTVIGEANTRLGEVLLQASQVEEARPILEQAVTRLEGRADVVEARALAVLSRVYMRAGESAKSISMADRALTIAERLDDEEVVAEALINKASSLGNIGRRRESNALHEAALQITQRLGLVAMEMRLRNNYAIGLGIDDPRLGLRMEDETAALSERLGVRSQYLWALGSADFMALDTGDSWDDRIATIRSLLETTLSEYDRERFGLVIGAYDILRGDATDEQIRELKRVRRDGGDPNLIAGMLSAEGEYLLLKGQLQQAERRYREASELSNDLQFYNLVFIARCVLWRGDAAAVRPLLSKLDDDPYSGPWAAAMRTAFRAGLDALEGRTAEAIGGYRSAIERLIEPGWLLDAVRLTIDAAYVLGGRPELASHVQRVEAIIDELRLKPHRARLEDALAQSAPALAERTRTQPAGTPA